MLTGAFYYDAIRNVNGVGGNGGKRRAGVLEAEYALSKATQLYASADYNQVCGGAATEMPGRDNQTGVALGLRHVLTKRIVHDDRAGATARPRSIKTIGGASNEFGTAISGDRATRAGCAAR